MFSVYRRAIIRAQVAKMTSKMSKFSPLDAKVLGVETMVWHVFGPGQTIWLMTEALIASERVKVDQTE